MEEEAIRYCHCHVTILVSLTVCVLTACPLSFPELSLQSAPALQVHVHMHVLQRIIQKCPCTVTHCVMYWEWPRSMKPCLQLVHVLSVAEKDGRPSRRVAVQGCEEGKPAAHNEGIDRVSQLHSAFPECGGRIRSPTVDMVCDAAVGV